jgi:CheY-like chemotaxis protein
MAEKLLLADDSVTIQKVVELTLADEDYDITMVSDGMSALKKAEEVHPDLILADVVMPELNGYELCEKIKQHPSLSHTPVMLLSSTFETYDEARGKSVGADDHIIKPFESEELIQKIRGGLEKKGEKPAETFEAAPATGFEAAPAAGFEAAPDAGFEAAPDAGFETAQTPEPSMDAMGLEPELVEDESFDFELTDEFMEQAEEMFVSKSDEFESSSLESPEETEEFLTEELPGLEEIGLSDTQSPFEEPQPEIPQTSAPTQEISADFIEEFTQPVETVPSDSYKPEAVQEEISAPQEEEQIPQWNDEIDKELLEEEDVNVYEIPEEYAEGSGVGKMEPVGSDTPFTLNDTAEDSSRDLIGEFMSTDEMYVEPDAAPATEQDVTEDEIVGAFQAESEVVAEEIIDLEPAVSSVPEEAVDSFEDIFPTQGAATSEWSPELSAYGEGPETVTDEVVEKPIPEEVVSRPAPAVDEEAVRKIVSEMVEKMASDIIEKVSWEVIPDLAEIMIQKEIQRLQQEVKPS